MAHLTMVLVLLQMFELVFVVRVIRQLSEVSSAHIAILKKLDETLIKLETFASHNARGIDMLVAYYSRADILKTPTYRSRKKVKSNSLPAKKIIPVWGFGEEIPPIS